MWKISHQNVVYHLPRFYRDFQARACVWVDFGLSEFRGSRWTSMDVDFIHSLFPLARPRLHEQHDDSHPAPAPTPSDDSRNPQTITIMAMQRARWLSAAAR